MMTLILYDNWLEAAHQKIRVGGKMKSRMSRAQIKALLRLCVTADKVEFLSNRTLYQFK
jgi:hypothetical protein